MATQLEWLLGRYLAIRSRSEAEIRRYIEQKRRKISVSDAYVEQLITRFRRLGLIDDVKFAESLAHALVTAKTKGPRLVQQKLQAAGVDREIITQTLKEIDRAAVLLAMEKRISRYRSQWGDLDPRTRYAKAYNKLLTSGFPSSEIRPFLDEWLQRR